MTRTWAKEAASAKEMGLERNLEIVMPQKSKESKVRVNDAHLQAQHAEAEAGRLSSAQGETMGCYFINFFFF